MNQIVKILRFSLFKSLKIIGTVSAGKVVFNRKRLAYSELAIWTKR